MLGTCPICFCPNFSMSIHGRDPCYYSSDTYCMNSVYFKESRDQSSENLFQHMKCMPTFHCILMIFFMKLLQKKWYSSFENECFEGFKHKIYMCHPRCSFHVWIMEKYWFSTDALSLQHSVWYFSPTLCMQTITVLFIPRYFNKGTQLLIQTSPLPTMHRQTDDNRGPNVSNLLMLLHGNIWNTPLDSFSH